VIIQSQSDDLKNENLIFIYNLNILNFNPMTDSWLINLLTAGNPGTKKHDGNG
jgi:hypothetical protein